MEHTVPNWPSSEITAAGAGHVVGSGHVMPTVYCMGVGAGLADITSGCHGLQQ